MGARVIPMLFVLTLISYFIFFYQYVIENTGTKMRLTPDGTAVAAACEGGWLTVG
jgi:hypothetical protein